MGLKVAGADLLFKGGLLSATKYVGLIDTSGDEINGNNYARQSMTSFGGSGSWQADGAEYENRQTIQFPQPTGGAWNAISDWGLYTALTSGQLLLTVDVSPDTAAPQIGADVAAAAEAIAVGITGVTTAGSLAMLQTGLLSGTRYLTLHTASPGTTGANVIFTDGVVWDGSNQGSKTLVAVQANAGDWTLDDMETPARRRARPNKSLTFGRQTADLPDPTHMALRDGNAHNSGVLWSSAITAADPGLGATLQFLANSIELRLPVDAA